MVSNSSLQEMRPATSSRSLPKVHKKKPQHRRVQSDEGSALVANEIPYRLPKVELSQSLPTPRSTITRRISSSHETTSHDLLYKIDYMGSESLEKYFQRREKLPDPPNTIAQLKRQEGIHMPTFKRANIRPIGPNNKMGGYSENLVQGHTASRTSLATRGTTGLPGIFKSSELMQHSSNGTKQAAWRLSPYQHKNYDVQAIRGQTGPFSRDFIIHCNTPNSWLRMKLKSQKTDH
ncbi:uncharacterized protein LOC117291793 [Asterias rubens]|uniref:uncharacterized protein LOC117291793 n=1 Tax=Asterias rubens TaxID=7604 RepID=UPI001455B90B|nr:uncharacterized protein LOC117291793 [Asterias rubens]XP_033629598.1 uncharacterized protein LOC117291793 [Asterias rubens]